MFILFNNSAINSLSTGTSTSIDTDIIDVRGTYLTYALTERNIDKGQLRTRTAKQEEVMQKNQFTMICVILSCFVVLFLQNQDVITLDSFVECYRACGLEKHSEVLSPLDLN